MTEVIKNQATAGLRQAHLVITQDDGATPADPWVDFTGFVFVGSGQSLAAAAGTIVNKRVPLSFSNFVFTSSSTGSVVSATGHGLKTGWGPFWLDPTAGTLSAGSLPSTNYWAIYVDANNFKLATSYANAIAGTNVALTTNSTGTCNVTLTGVTSPEQGVYGAFMYTLSQAETNVSSNELTVMIIKSGYAQNLTLVHVRDLADVQHAAVDSIADSAVVSIWSGAGSVLEGSYTASDLTRFIARWLGGKASDFRTNTVTIRDLLDTKDCITVTTAASGRTGLTIIDPS